MVKVLFVCLGNICRSPLAEAQFMHEVKCRGLSGQIHADSCGTASYHVGRDADARSIRVARANNIDITHKGRQLSEEDFYTFDYMFVMDADNYRDVLQVKPRDSACEVLYLRSFDTLAGGCTEVPDPYYGGDADFDTMYQQINQSVSGLLDHLASKHQL